MSISAYIELESLGLIVGICSGDWDITVESNVHIVSLWILEKLMILLHFDDFRRGLASDVPIRLQVVPGTANSRVFTPTISREKITNLERPAISGGLYRQAHENTNYFSFNSASALFELFLDRLGGNLQATEVLSRCLREGHCSSCRKR